LARGSGAAVPGIVTKLEFGLAPALGVKLMKACRSRTGETLHGTNSKVSIKTLKVGYYSAVDEHAVSEPRTLGGPVRNHQIGGESAEKISRRAVTRNSFCTTLSCYTPLTQEKPRQSPPQTTNSSTENSTTTVLGLITTRHSPMLPSEKTCGYGAYSLSTVSYSTIDDASVTSRPPSGETSILRGILPSARHFR